jgi:uncharacterized membrane protein
MLGAFQFAPGFRRRHRRWHRTAGRVLVVAGLTVAVSGAWMTVAYDLPPYDGAVVNAVRLMVSAAMVTSIVLAVVAIRRRDIGRHRAWMIRAYALAMGAGTQVFTLVPWTLVAGPPGVSARAALMTAAWVINLAVAEWIIRRPAGHRTARPAPRPALVTVD